MDNTWYMEGAQEYRNEHDMMPENAEWERSTSRHAERRGVQDSARQS